MRREEALAKIKDMRTEERIDRATVKAEQLADFSTTLLQTHANNKILTYSDLLTSQLQPSFAAHDYNNVEHVMFLGEIVMLVALWDAVDLNKVSIPTIVALVGTDAVKNALFETKHAVYAHGRVNIVKWDQFDNGDIARERYRMRELERSRTYFDRFWRSGVILAGCVMRSKRLKSLVDLRARQIAHNFDLKDASFQAKPFEQAKYGYERRLLNTTLVVANGLNGAIRNASFDYEGSRQQCDRNARELWEACSIRLPDLYRNRQTD